MEQLNGRPVLPVCILLHELINQLSVIIGHCDIGMERSPLGSDSARRFKAIGETAHHVIRGMRDHQCELNGLLRITVIGKDKFLANKKPASE